MDSINPDCKPLKHAFGACFKEWYAQKFLQGLWTGQEEDVPCEELFYKYQACVKKTLNEKNVNINDVLRDIFGTCKGTCKKKQSPVDPTC